MFGEGSTPEAYVPVPAGRIPVEIKAPANSNQRPINVTINVHGQRRRQHGRGAEGHGVPAGAGDAPRDGMTMAFPTYRLPPDIEEGAQGGPEFATVIQESVSGQEQRIKVWAKCRARYDIAYSVLNSEDPVGSYKAVLALFYAHNGRFRPFRFKDWGDYQAERHDLRNRRRFRHDVPACPRLTTRARSCSARRDR